MKNYLLFLCVLFLFAACKTPTYLSTPKDFKDQVTGLHFTCSLDGKTEIVGEIIAVDSSTIKLLPINGDGLMTISKDEIEKGDIIVALTSDNPQKIKTWSTIVSLMPIGHGVFGVVTLPITLAATIPMSYNAAKGVYRVNYPDNVYWEDMSKFARFPQGIPESIDPKRIKQLEYKR